MSNLLVLQPSSPSIYLRQLVFIGVLALTTTPVSAQSNPTAGAADSKADRTGGAAADTAWTKLRDKAATGKSAQAPGQTASANWKDIAADAQAFQRDFPGHAQARAAGKIAADALIRADDEAPDLSQNAKAVAESFVDDLKNPGRDRLDIKITLEQAKLRRGKFANGEQRRQAHVAHARELIRLFPEQPEGYGYLLSQAKSESLDGSSHRLADELLQSNAPDGFKRGARRVIERLQLVGRPLPFIAAENVRKSAQKKVLVVYTWRESDTGFLEIVRTLAKTGDTVFVGVNLDDNTGAARARAAAQKLPGTQFYDGNGLNGPIAEQLKLVVPQSIFLVDSKGTIRDVNGPAVARKKLTKLVLDEEGRP